MYKAHKNQLLTKYVTIKVNNLGHCVKNNTIYCVSADSKGLPVNFEKSNSTRGLAEYDILGNKINETAKQKMGLTGHDVNSDLPAWGDVGGGGGPSHPPGGDITSYPSHSPNNLLGSFKPIPFNPVHLFIVSTILSNWTIILSDPMEK